MLSTANAKDRTLGTLLASRDNNFDALRLVAAFGVIFSHSYPLRDGDEAREPYRVLSGYCTIGEVAVGIFFVVSGLLVARSFLSDPNAWSYLRKRLLRIMPGLVVCVAACMLILGPIFTTLPLKAYFHDRNLAKFARNGVLLPGRFDLPGVFVDPDGDWSSPQSAVNGSLWTLPMEFIMYLGVLGLGMAHLLRRKWCVGLVALAMLAEWLFVVHLMQRPDFQSHFPLVYKYRVWLDPLPHLGFLFFAGTLLLLFKDAVVIDWRWGVACAVVVAASWRTAPGYLLFTLCLPYLIMCLAFAKVPWLKPVLQSMTKWGDFSYGVYLYGYPVEQIVIRTWPTLGLATTMFLSCAGTLLIAVISWHLVEKPFLKLKKRSAHPLLKDRNSQTPLAPVTVSSVETSPTRSSALLEAQTTSS